MKHYQPNMYYLSYLGYLDRKDGLARAKKGTYSMAVKIMKYSLCNKAAKLISSQASNPRLDSMIFFLYSVKTAR